MRKKIEDAKYNIQSRNKNKFDLNDEKPAPLNNCDSFMNVDAQESIKTNF
jgi:hypothetical protein